MIRNPRNTRWMVRGFLLALAALPASAQEEQGETPPPGVPPVAAEAAVEEPAPPQAPRFDHPFSIEEIEAAAADLVAAHPSLARMETVGVSRGGRSIVALVITDAALVPAGAKPALMVIDHLGTPRARGAEVGLALAWDLATRHAADAEVQRLLGDVAIYVLPALDPDARVRPAEGTQAPERLVQFDRNFPIGWLPDSLRTGSGDYPLSEPETLAAARFLEAHPDVVAVVDAVEPIPSVRPSDPREVMPDQDEWLFGGSSKWREPDAWLYLDRRGSLLEHAYWARGILPFSFVLTQSSGSMTVEQEVTWLASQALVFAKNLPRVGLREKGLNRLGPGLWQLDVVLENTGAFPTRSALAQERFPGAGIQLTIAGATLVATAGRAREEDAYQVLTAHVPEGQNTISAGNLDGGQARWLRLILQAEAGTEITVTGCSAAAGTARLVRVLP